MSWHCGFHPGKPLGTCWSRRSKLSRPAFVPWVPLVRLRASAPGYDHQTGSQEEILVIDWEDGGNAAPDDGIASAWDYAYLSDGDVEANLADAATYRILVQRFPDTPSNVKLLHSFRDNVTRKLAPVVARAFSLHPTTGSLAFLMHFYHDEEFGHGGQQDVQPAPPACLAATNQGSGGDTALLTASRVADSNAPDAVLRHQHPQQEEQEQHQVADSECVHVLALPLESLNTAAVVRGVPRPRRRRGSRGSGRTLVHGAGRQGLVESPVA